MWPRSFWVSSLRTVCKGFLISKFLNRVPVHTLPLKLRMEIKEVVKEWVTEWIKEWVKELVKELVKEWGSGALMEVGKDCAKDCVYVHGFCDVDKVFAYIHVFLARGIR